jgi:hypothetical protein
MYPFLQFQNGGNGPSKSRPNAPIGSGAVPRHLLAELLLILRERPAQLPERLCADLGLLAYHCVLARRAGTAPSSAAIHAYMEALANNLPLRHALHEAGRALAAAGVRAIVYKGQDYLERIYGELGARSMADVDLLVPEAELGRAERALLQAGFIADTSCRLMHERKFCKDGLAIDLHHALLQPARMAAPHAELFARAEPCAYAPGLWVLEATDAFLVHCVNQTVKGYHLPPSSYIELQALLAQADPETALQRARGWRAQCALYTSLAALAELGHPLAHALARRVALSDARRRLLDAVVVAFALRTLTREQPSRATMLALKTTLIDEPRAIARFVPQWFAWQMPFKPPRPLAAGEPASRAPPTCPTSTTSTVPAASCCGPWSTQRPSC